jgi:hypothetical protein
MISNRFCPSAEKEELMKCFTWSCAMIAAALAAPPSAAQTQDDTPLQCLQPAPEKANAPCTLTARRNPGLEPIVVQLKVNDVPQADVPVTFSVEPGGSLSNTLVRTNANGEARTTWSGELSAPVTVTAVAEAGETRHTRTIQIKAPEPAPSPHTLSMRPSRNGDKQAWYEKRQLRDPLIVDVVGADATSCDKEVVVFRPTGGGSVSPDSVRAEWIDSLSLCSARVRWRLGEGVGEQHLRAQLAGGSGEKGRSEHFTATARALPRLTAGLAFTGTSGYTRVISTADTVVVTRQSADSTVTTRRVTGHKAPDRVEGDWTVTPVVGFDWPIIPRVHGLRVSAAASLADPDKEWMFGVSLLQIPFGLQHEAVGVSLHMVAQVSRRKVVEDPQACRTLEQCDTNDGVRFTGAGLMFVTDAATALGTLTSIFGL